LRDVIENKIQLVKRLKKIKRIRNEFDKNQIKSNYKDKIEEKINQKEIKKIKQIATKRIRTKLNKK
jgi:hypothetical protein